MDDSLSYEEFRPLLRELMKRAYRNLEAGPDGLAGGCAEALNRSEEMGTGKPHNTIM